MELRRLWYHLQCRYDRHSPKLFYVGHNIGKECKHCLRTLVLTPQELQLFKTKVFE